MSSYSPSFFLFGVVMIAVWGVSFWWAWKNHRPYYAFILLLATVYCYVGESYYLQRGTYCYGPFKLAIRALPIPMLGSRALPPSTDCDASKPVPVAVLAVEGALFFSILRTTDLLAPPTVVMPFLDGLIVLSLDAILDPVVSSSKWIGQGPGQNYSGLQFWTWFTSQERMGHWYGVPFANYTGWFCGIVAFTAGVRWVARRLGIDRRAFYIEAGHALGAILLATLFLAALAIPLKFVIDKVLDLSYTWAWQAGVMLALVLISLGIVLPSLRHLRRHHKVDWLPMLPPLAVFAFCLLALPFVKTSAERGQLLLVWLVTAVVGVGFALAPYSGKWLAPALGVDQWRK